MKSINLAAKFKEIDELWSPRIIASLNDSFVKLVKLEGAFIWHSHDKEDELFLVVEGRLLIEFRDRDLWLEPGKITVIPRGVEHRPIADEVVQVVLIEPKTTINTGDVQGNRTVEASWL